MLHQDGCINSHDAHLVPVLRGFLVRIGHQSHLLQVVGESQFSFPFAVIGEVLDTVQQLFHVFIPAHILGGLVRLQVPDDPRFSDQWFLHQSNDADIDAPEGIYNDIWLCSVGYAWPVENNTTYKVGLMHVTQAVDDDKRTLTLRLDRIWAVGVGFSKKYGD